jgi:hypothetical protein
LEIPMPNSTGPVERMGAASVTAPSEIYAMITPFAFKQEKATIGDAHHQWRELLRYWGEDRAPGLSPLSTWESANPSRASR